ncbi:MAG: hypothetical protein CL912_02875 [Deltaproteobacteria bacterium]|nr:hypothetical protein [Deltaproteobacteria bacterium]
MRVGVVRDINDADFGRRGIFVAEFDRREKLRLELCQEPWSIDRFKDLTNGVLMIAQNSKLRVKHRCSKWTID